MSSNDPLLNCTLQPEADDSAGRERSIFEQKCREMRRKGLTATEGLDETRKMALQIIENGTGWIYIHKKETEMLKDMKVLMDKWIAVESCIREGKCAIVIILYLNEDHLLPIEIAKFEDIVSRTL